MQAATPTAPASTPAPATNTPQQKNHNKNNHQNNSNISHVQYNAIVVDTNAIIKGAGLHRLLPSCKDTTMQSFYTVPGVFNEIVDKKAKAHLENLPFQLIPKEPSPKAIKTIADFAKKTGDYRELSLVDLHILALTYDLEVLGCGGDASHVRTEPKHKLGGGRVVPMNQNADAQKNAAEKGKTEGATDQPAASDDQKSSGIMESGAYELQIEECDEEEESDSESEMESEVEEEQKDNETNAASSGPKLWAAIVNPEAASKKVSFSIGDEMLNQPFGQMNLSASANKNDPISMTEIQQEQKEQDLGGQFSDAEEDEDDDDFGLEYADSDAEMSDEECDVYILDPEEAEARKKGLWNGPDSKSMPTPTATTTSNAPFTTTDPAFTEELNSDFPSLAAASTVPYEGSDDEADPNPAPPTFEENLEAKKEASLQKIGKTWNSFRGKDKHLFAAKGLPQRRDEQMKEWELEKERHRLEMIQERAAAAAKNQKKNKKNNFNPSASRIIGGMDLAGQSEQVDDDGEGWVTVSNIKSIKASGMHGFSFKDLSTNNSNNDANKKTNKKLGPDPSNRCACATTDFAMQNILLQMGMVLLSIDGMAVRKVKHWVTRCATCFTVYGGNDSKTNKLGGRLFCDKCGGSHLERVSASVDSKTGRYRLYLSKRRKPTKRGTKFSLPKPGKVCSSSLSIFI